MEFYILKMVAITRVNGKTIKCMDSVNFIMKMVKLHMRVTGMTINSMDKEEFITHSLLLLNRSLITKISLSLEIGGFIMKDNLRMTPNTEKDILS